MRIFNPFRLMSARFALAAREPRCARCWRDLSNRDWWLFKCVDPAGAHLIPDHYCKACRYRDGEDAPRGWRWICEWSCKR